MERLFIINILVVILGVSLVLWVKKIIVDRKIRKYKKKIFRNYDELELRLMVGYNYVKNLPVINSMINEYTSEFRCQSQDKVIRRTLYEIENTLYSSSLIDKTTYYENEFLYKKNVLNLSLVIEAFKIVLSDSVHSNTRINSKIKFIKKLKRIELKSRIVLLFKGNKINYYIRVEKLKKKYLELIYMTSPDVLVFFIKDSIKKISEV